jgi:hypothetical protein
VIAVFRSRTAFLLEVIIKKTASFRPETGVLLPRRASDLLLALGVGKQIETRFTRDQEKALGKLFHALTVRTRVKQE